VIDVDWLNSFVTVLAATELIITVIFLNGRNNEIMIGDVMPCRKVPTF